MFNDKKMTTILKQPTKYSIYSMQEKYPYKLCRTADSEGDLSKPWYVEYYIWSETEDKLRRKRVVLAQSTAKQRHAAAKEITKYIDSCLLNGDIVNPKVKPKSATISAHSTVIEAIKYFLEFTEKSTKKRTAQSYKCDLGNFEKYILKSKLEHTSLIEFNEVAAMAYLDYLTIEGIKNRRRNNLKGTLGTFFIFFKNRKIIDENPFANTKKLNSVARAHMVFSEANIKRMKTQCLASNQEQLWLFISFIYYTAIRPGEELRRLMIRDIKEKTIFIKGETAKNNQSEHIMIPEPLEKLITQHKLRSYPPNHYVFSSNNEPGEKLLGINYFYNKHLPILKKLDLANQHFDLYSWKHTGAVALYKVTQTLEIVRKHCRHSDLATTEKYLKDLGIFTDYTQINKFPEI